MHSSYNAYSQKLGHKRWRVVIAIIIGVALVAAIASWLIMRGNAQSTPPPSSITTPAPIITKAINSKVMFVGDIFWGRRMNTWAQASDLKNQYPFSGLSDFDRAAYDAWVGNMECPTDPSVIATATQEEKLLQFNCPATYLPELAKWFNIVSLANNHTDNHGAKSFTETRLQLTNNNIQYFGHYDPAIIDEVCEAISLPVRIQYSDQSQKSGNIPFALCGYHGVFKIPTDSSLAKIKEYAAYMPVIAYPHMGVEYQSKSDKLRENLYRKMIDYGADAVLANHPHWVQNSEAYKGKLIVYSMGNFIFDQQGSTELTRSGVVTLDVSTTDAATSEQLDKWLALGEQCKTFGDTCLSQAKQGRLTKLPLTLTYGLSASDNHNKVTHKATPAVTKAVAERLNWNTTVKELLPEGIPIN